MKYVLVWIGYQLNVLAAREDVYGVCVGGVLGHALCTGLAVLGGRIIATRISVRTVTLVSYTLLV